MRHSDFFCAILNKGAELEVVVQDVSDGGKIEKLVCRVVGQPLGDTTAWPTGWAPTDGSGRWQEVSIPVKRGSRFSEVSEASSHINANWMNFCLSHAHEEGAAVAEEPGVVKKCNLAAGVLGKSPGRAIAHQTV